MCLRRRGVLPTGLKQLVLEKQQADELAAALARERAKEDAEFAAAEAAAAALEWEKVYVVRTEREEAVKRAEEAEEKLRKVAHDASQKLSHESSHIAKTCHNVHANGRHA